MGRTMTRRRPDHRNAEVANEGVEEDIERLIALITKVQSFDVAGRSEGGRFHPHDVFLSKLECTTHRSAGAVL